MIIKITYFQTITWNSTHSRECLSFIINQRVQDHTNHKQKPINYLETGNNTFSWKSWWVLTIYYCHINKTEMSSYIMGEDVKGLRLWQFYYLFQTISWYSMCQHLSPTPILLMYSTTEYKINLMTSKYGDFKSIIIV